MDCAMARIIDQLRKQRQTDDNALCGRALKCMRTHAERIRHELLSSPRWTAIENALDAGDVELVSDLFWLHELEMAGKR